MSEEDRSAVRADISRFVETDRERSMASLKEAPSRESMVDMVRRLDTLRSTRTDEVVRLVEQIKSAQSLLENRQREIAVIDRRKSIIRTAIRAMEDSEENFTLQRVG